MMPSRRAMGENFPVPHLLRIGGLWAGLFLLLAPPGAWAQAATPGSGCEVPHFDRLTNLALSNGSRVSYFSAPVIVCSQGVRISADSAVVYETSNYTQLFRNVEFRDAESLLTADQAYYFNEEDRLRAWGSVVLTDLAEGSVIRGDTMVLLRAGSGRSEDRLTVTGRRPRATLYPTRQPVAPEAEGVPGDPAASEAPDTAGAPVERPDSTAPPLRPPDSMEVVLPAPDSAATRLRRPDSLAPQVPETDPSEVGEPEPSLEERVPWEIDARRIFLEGSRYFRATGNVFIHRDSVDAVADSVEYDGDQGTLFLSREARLNTTDFELSARDILLDIPQDDIRAIEARHESILEGDDLQLLAPTIRMFLAEGELDRLVAVGDPALDSLPEENLAERPPHQRAQELGFPQFPIRPHAYAQDFLLWGDSIEVEAPGNVLEEVKAMGQARGESMTGDSLNTGETPSLIRRDWLEGDTIIAMFSSRDGEGGGEMVAEEAVEEVLEVAPPPAAADRESEAQADSSRYRLDQLVARGNARSLYRMAPSDSTVAEEAEEEEEQRLAVHYVLGDEITILMAQGEVDRMEVKGATRGIHLEPVKPERRRGGGLDEERGRIETSGSPPDTAGVARPPPGGRP